MEVVCIPLLWCDTIPNFLRALSFFGLGVLYAVIVHYGLKLIDKAEEIYNEYHHPENALKRATRNWEQRSHGALEDFKNEVRDITRR